MGLRPPLRGSPWGAVAPAAIAAMRGCGPAPRGARAGARRPAAGAGRHPARLGLPSSPQTLFGMRAWSRLAAGPFCALRVPCCAGAPAPARVRSGAARPPPLRCPGPSPSSLPRFARSPGPPPGPCPPALSLGPCAPLRGSVASRWPRCASGLALSALRAPCSVALASRRVRSGRFAGSPPGPPWARPLARLRGRSAPGPGASAGLWPACFGLRPRGLCAARPRLRGLAVRCLLPLWWSWVLPCLPPAPAAPRWGARGERQASGLGGSRPRPFGPPLWVGAASVSGSPLSHCPPRVKASLRRGYGPGLDPLRAFLSGALDNRRGL
jgi:hypothetical protein